MPFSRSGAPPGANHDLFLDPSCVVNASRDLAPDPGALMPTVLDSSAMLAYLFEEPGWQTVEAAMDEAIVCSVNLAEVVATLIERGHDGNEAASLVQGFVALTLPFSAIDALKAGALRASTRPLGLSLGGRACLALAATTNARVLTADRAWSQLPLELTIELIR